MDVTKIRALRDQNQLTQEKMARLLGVSVRTVVRWERGVSTPSPLALANINKLSGETAEKGFK